MVAPAPPRLSAPASITDAELARRYGVSKPTIAKWRRRTTVHDESHTAHRLQTTLTPAQECIVVELRKVLRLALDDLLVVVREFLNPHVSRAGLGRCLAVMASVVCRNSNRNRRPTKASRSKPTNPASCMWM